MATMMTMLNECVVRRVDVLHFPLVNHFYAHCHYHVKCGRHDRVFSVRWQGDIIAAARLMSHPQGHFILRNLCVAPGARKQGVATLLLTHIVEELASLNTGVSCYCYVLPHLQCFYLALGFAHLTLEQVPQDVAEAHVRNCARKRGWVLMGYTT